MNSKVAVAFALALLTLLSTQVIFTDLAGANFFPLPPLPTPIYIRSDGSVDPATAPIMQVGDLYTLTGNINTTIEIQRSHIVLNGGGFNLTKPAVGDTPMAPVGWLPGVNVTDLSNVTVTNFAFEGCVTGVTVNNSSDITISQNIMNCQTGVAVFSSSNVDIIGNYIALGNQSFATGISLLPSTPDAANPSSLKIEGNLIVGSSTEVPTSPAPQPDQYGLWGLFSDSQVVNNNFTNIKGIGLYEMASNNLIAGNNFQDNYEGILVNSNSALFYGNTFCGNNFNHNTENVVIPYIRNYNPATNRWDNGSVGNYWSDYSGTDSNGDGIGDTPYVLQTVYTDYPQNQNATVDEGTDNHPAMTPSPIAVSAPKLQQTQPSSGAQTSASNQEPFLTQLAIVGAVIVVLLGLTVAVYVKKRPIKHEAKVSAP